MIKNLRGLVNPRRFRFFQPVYPTVPIDINTSTYKTLGTVNVSIPTWATRSVGVANVSGIGINTASAQGGMRVRLGTSLASAETGWDENFGSSASRTHYMAGGELIIASALRGTVQPFLLEARRTAGSGFLRADASTSVFLDIEFFESASD